MVVLTLLVVGCTGDQQESGTDRAPSSLPFAEPADDGAESAIIPSSDSNAKEPAPLRISMARPASYDPREISLVDQGAVIIGDLLYDGLTEAVGAEGRLRPALALEWRASDDFMAWTFTVDTERVTVESVVAAFESLGRLDGTPATLVGDRISSVEATSPTEVLFRLDRPEAGFAWLLSGLPLSVVGADGSPTGRYEIVSEDNDGLVLHSVDDAGTDVAVMWADDAESAYDALTLGRVDAAVASPEDLTDAASRFGHIPPARSISRFFVVSSGSTVLDDDEVRASVVAAIDRERLVADALAGGAYAIEGVVAPTTAGFRANACGSTCDRGSQSVSPSNTDELTLAQTNPTTDPLTSAVVTDLESLGFDVTVESVTPDELARSIAIGGADLHAAGWIATAGSIDAVVPALFASTSQVNLVSLEAGVDELIVTAANTVDDRDRWALLATAQEQALAEARILPIAAARSHFVAAPQAQDVAVRADGSLDLGAPE